MLGVLFAPERLSQQLSWSAQVRFWPRESKLSLEDFTRVVCIQNESPRHRILTAQNTHNHREEPKRAGGLRKRGFAWGFSEGL